MTNYYNLYTFEVNDIIRKKNIDTSKMKINELDNEQYLALLIKKIINNTRNLEQCNSSQTLKQLGEILEILRSYGEVNGYSLKKIQEEMEKKNKEEGEYNKKYYCQSITLSSNEKSEIQKYLQKKESFPLKHVQEGEIGKSIYHFQVQKLVRDKFHNYPGTGDKILNDSEYENEIKKKLLEEVNEIVNADNMEEIIEEFADLTEVINTYYDFKKISNEEVEKKRIQKNKELGGFKRRVYHEYIKVNSQHVNFKHYIKNHKKYPLCFIIE